jgi:hypothetical protein
MTRKRKSTSTTTSESPDSQTTTIDTATGEPGSSQEQSSDTDFNPAEFDTVDSAPEAAPPRANPSRLARQTMMTNSMGVRLIHEMQKGCYRIRFDPAMEEQEFKAFFNEKLKPLLIERHELQGGPEARFYYQPDSRDWEIRYRYRARDADGQEIIEDGKPKWHSCHKQVQLIAERICDRATDLIADKLGLRRPEAPIPD